MKHHVVRRRQRGSAMAAMLIAVVLCGALSASVVLTNTGRQKEADAELNRERAFQLAEAGVDWALAQIRIRNGTVPTGTDVQSVPGSGTFTIRYNQGNTNGFDDNGDGIVDDAAEAGFAAATSTGESGGIRRTLLVLLRKAVEIPTFNSAVQFNVETPIFDVDGNAFRMSGAEHNLDGTVDTTRAEKYGISSPAAAADIVAQIPSSRIDNITGLGGNPSIGNVPAIDLARLVLQAQSSASILLTPGTHSGATLGSTSPFGTVVAYCNGDLHLSGTSSGAGILAVDGDLRISGGFEWTGIILVRGRVEMVGGGSGKRLIGALAVGEEVTSNTSSTTVEIGGTINLLYSSDAVALAAESFSVMTLMSWREVGNP